MWVQNKSKGFSPTAVSASHIGAKIRRRRTIFLGVARGAVLAEVAGTNTVFYSHLEIFPQCGIAVLYFR
jgi:hypothetical protein